MRAHHVLIAVALSSGAASAQGVMSGIKRISSGFLTSCSLDTAGVVRCWGNNDLGQLGDPIVTAKHAFARTIPLPAAARDVAVGGIHACALLVDGGVQCWGGNYAGQLGDQSSVAYRASPGPVVGLNGATAISAGVEHTCALTDAGSVYCWGNNGSGRLGVGYDVAALKAPAPVANMGSGVSAIFAGGYQTCAVQYGRLKCWGRNMYGTLGDGTKIDRLSAVDVVGLGEAAVRSVSSSAAQTCAVLEGGATYCWGTQLNGVLGIGNDHDAYLSPVRIDLEPAVAVTAGENETCALLADGRAKCWGSGDYGSVGDGSYTLRQTPVDSARAPAPWSALSAGRTFVCGLANTSVYCWGDNRYGQLGTGAFEPSTSAVPAFQPAPGRDIGWVQDIWWGGEAENGWGMTLTQHRETLFAVLYIYDAKGKPTWVVMSGGSWNADKTSYQGALYRPKASPWNAYDASRFSAGAPVGQLRLTFKSLDAITMDATIDGVTTTKSLVRQPFSSPVSDDFVSDMWWGGEAQGGWGIACTVRTSAFITWFTYDSAGNPIWYVVSDSHPALGGTLGNTTAGTLYVTQSSPWGSSYTPASLRVTPVGTLHFDWDLHAHAGNLGVSMGGITLEIPLQRQPF